MKIAWLCPYPVSELNDLLEGGVRKSAPHPCSWIMNLSRALAKRQDVELHIVTLCAWITHSQTVQRDGMTIHVLKNGIPFTRRGWPSSFPLDTISGYRIERKRIIKELSSIQPDIIHAHGTEREYALTAQRSRFPYLISIQGIVAEFNKTDPSRHFRLMEPRERLAVEKSNYFTCRTHFDTGFIRRLNPTAKIFDIAEAMNPVFWEEQWSETAGNRVLFVGGGAVRKGLHELIDAAGIVARNIPDMVIDVVGNCSLERRDFLQKKAESCGVKIDFHGFLAADAIATLHRECNLFVLSSSNENSPNTLAEAMVSGMPVVSYNVGGVSSMIDDTKTGFLVKPHDVAELANKIEDLLTHREKARTLGAAAADVARERHWPDTVADKTVEAYKFILCQGSD